MISLLEPLYQEALAGRRIQITMMVSNHGTFDVTAKTFEMEGAIPGARIGEQDLAYIGRLMAPMDTIIVNGTCFGTDHVDLISQHMIQHRDELIKEHGMVDLAEVSACSVTRALLGRPAFITKSAFEGDVFSQANQGLSIQDAFLRTMKGEVIGHTALGMGADPWGSNLPLTSSDKLAFHMRAFYAYKDLEAGTLDGTGFSNTTVTPNFVDEGDGAVFAHQFDSTYVDLRAVAQLPELRAALLADQKAVEAQIAELDLPGLRDFSFSDEPKGPAYAQAISQALLQREGAGIKGGNYAGTELEKLMRIRAILQKYASGWGASRTIGREVIPYDYNDIYYSDDPKIKTFRGEPVTYIFDGMADVEERIAALTVGNDAHRWKLAAAMIGRHLMAAQWLTDPSRFIDDGNKMNRLQQLYTAYKTAERQRLIPELFYVEEAGQRIRKSIKRITHDAPADHVAQSTPAGQ